MTSRGDRIVRNETKHVRKFSTWGEWHLKPMGEERIFKRMVLEQLVSHLGVEGGDPFLLLYTRKKSKWIKNLSVKSKTIKL